MRAVIVFADGSKREAHNLDDTRERWELRRGTDFADIVRSFNDGLSIPVLDENLSVDELKAAQQRLSEQRAALVAVKMDTQNVRSASPALRAKVLHLVDAALAQVRVERQKYVLLLEKANNAQNERSGIDPNLRKTAGRLLNRWLLSNHNPDEADRKIVRQDCYIRYLSDLLSDAGIEYAQYSTFVEQFDVSEPMPDLLSLASGDD